MNVFPISNVTRRVAKLFTVLCLLSSFVIISSCKRSPKSPAEVSKACLKSLAAKDVEGASEFFYKKEKQQKWFDTYYGSQPIEELFDAAVGNVFVHEKVAVVTYTPKKTLFNAFGSQDLLILKKEEGKWLVDLEESIKFKNAINGGGVKTNLSILGSCVKDASKKLGHTPKTVQEIIDNLDVKGAKDSVRAYSRIFDYYPEGKTIDGVEGVIFYTKQPYRYGMFLGATKKMLFLSGDGKLIIDTKISLL